MGDDSKGGEGPRAGVDELLAPLRTVFARLLGARAFRPTDIQAAIAQLTETCSEALRVERASVWRFCPDRTALVCLDLFERGARRHSSGKVLLRADSPTYFRALEKERTIAAEDAAADPRTAEFRDGYLLPFGITSMLDAPIWLAGELVGVLCHEQVGEPRAWTPSEQLISGTFADFVAMILGVGERASHDEAMHARQLELRGLVDERTRELSREQRLLDTVLACTPFGLAFFDAEARYVRVNDWLARLNGVPIAATVGRRPTEVLGHRKIAEVSEAEICKVLATKLPTDPVETLIELDGVERAFLTTFFPVVDADSVINVGCCVVDISAQRRGERERAELFEREHLALREAERANRAKDEFLAMLSHELRNPLAPIVTALHLMGSLGNVAQRERTIMKRQVGHLVRLVDDLLDVSRITGGKLELRRRPLEIATVIEKGLETASPLLEKHGHQIEVDVAVTGLQVDGDVDRLAQVLSNLLVNAAKYTPAKGRLLVSARDEEDEVVISVRDNGMGITPELLERLFDVFVQGERGIDRSEGGLGLGLAIVRGIVQAHGGRVWVRSDGRGRGSEFFVALPRLRRADVGVSADASAAGHKAWAKRILVIDDDEDAATTLSELLTLLGHQTDAALDGPSALARAAELSPDAALVDIGLPVMDGFELARRLRALPGLERIELVAITGYSRTDDSARYQEAGFRCQLLKPIAMQHVQRVLVDLFGPMTDASADGEATAEE